MKSRLKLEKLKSSLPTETIEALQTGGFFNADAEVKRTAIVTNAELEEGERAVVRYISTRDVDRDGEVLVPQGAQLDEYMLNPVVLWGHNYMEPPVGKAEWVKADKNGLKSKTLYADTERAEEVWELIKGGFLQTASVGFMPVERTWKGQTGWEDLVAKLNKKWGTDLEKDGAEIITTKWILLEYSDVPVPANPHALITAVAKGMELSDDMREQLEIPDPADTTKHTDKDTTTARRIILPKSVAKTRRMIVKAAAQPGQTRRRVVATIAQDTLDRIRGRV